MKRVMRAVLVVAVFAASPLCVCGDGEVWVKVTNHTHSPHSDGRDTMLEIGRRAKATGSYFCVITDHVESYRRSGGVEGWGTDFAKTAVQLHGEGLELVPGAEGALDTRPSGLMGANHMLVIGGSTGMYRQVEKIVVQSGDPDLMASRLRELADANGAVLIAAHPLCPQYPFDKKLLRFVDTIEVFDGTADPIKELRVIASHPEARNRSLPVVTGSDSHGDGVTRLDTLGNMVRLKGPEAARASVPFARRIWCPVSSTRTTREELIVAIKQNKVYASIAPARIVAAKTMPGGRHDSREVLGMHFDGINWPLGKSVHCLAIRRGDGATLEWDVPIQKTGDATGDVLLDFAKLPPVTLQKGSFLYLMIANQIATSGIELLPRSDVVVAKKKSFLDKVGDAIGKVADAIAPQQPPVATASGPSVPKVSAPNPVPPVQSKPAPGVIAVWSRELSERDDLIRLAHTGLSSVSLRFELLGDKKSRMSIRFIDLDGKAVLVERIMVNPEKIEDPPSYSWSWFGETDVPSLPVFRTKDLGLSVVRSTSVQQGRSTWTPKQLPELIDAAFSYANVDYLPRTQFVGNFILCRQK